MAAAPSYTKSTGFSFVYHAIPILKEHSHENVLEIIPLNYRLGPN
jgi:hypothetical protein